MGLSSKGQWVASRYEATVHSAATLLELGLPPYSLRVAALRLDIATETLDIDSM